MSDRTEVGFLQQVPDLLFHRWINSQKLIAIRRVLHQHPRCCYFRYFVFRVPILNQNFALLLLITFVSKCVDIVFEYGKPVLHLLAMEDDFSLFPLSKLQQLIILLITYWLASLNQVSIDSLPEIYALEF
jgi:hypothetical protein